MFGSSNLESIEWDIPVIIPILSNCMTPHVDSFLFLFELGNKYILNRIMYVEVIISVVTPTQWSHFLLYYLNATACFKYLTYI